MREHGEADNVQNHSRVNRQGAYVGGQVGVVAKCDISVVLTVVSTCISRHNVSRGRVRATDIMKHKERTASRLGHTGHQRQQTGKIKQA